MAWGTVQKHTHRAQYSRLTSWIFSMLNNIKLKSFFVTGLSAGMPKACKVLQAPVSLEFFSFPNELDIFLVIYSIECVRHPGLEGHCQEYLHLQKQESSDSGGYQISCRWSPSMICNREWNSEGDTLLNHIGEEFSHPNCRVIWCKHQLKHTNFWFFGCNRIDFCWGGSCLLSLTRVSVGSEKYLKITRVVCDLSTSSKWEVFSNVGVKISGHMVSFLPACKALFISKISRSSGLIWDLKLGGMEWVYPHVPWNIWFNRPMLFWWNFSWKSRLSKQISGEMVGERLSKISPLAWILPLSQVLWVPNEWSSMRMMLESQI